LPIETGTGADRHHDEHQNPTAVRTEKRKNDHDTPDPVTPHEF
jgi:hypothetical protein